MKRYLLVTFIAVGCGSNPTTPSGSRTGDAALFVDERGQRINGQWTGSPGPVEHDILTGSNADGTVATGLTCAGDTTAPWAISLRHRRGAIDLTGPARVRWRAKQSGFYEIRLILQITDKQWLVADQSDGPSIDWRERDFPIADLKWRTLDITRIVEGRVMEKVDLSKVLAIGVTDLRAGGGTPASSRLDWIEVYGTFGAK